MRNWWKELKNYPTKRKVLLGFLFLGAFLSGMVVSYLTLSLSKVFVKTEKTAVEKEVPQDTTPPQDYYNVLLLGYGGAGHEGGTLSDSIILANVIPAEKKVTFISIPRDLWVEIPIRSDMSQNFKINHAYAIGLNDTLYPLKEPQYKGEAGGAVMAKEVVGEVVGMPIDFFLAVDFEGLKNIVDELGGVEVNVPVTFDDYFYPIKGRENDTCGKLASEIARLHEEYSDTALHHQFECRYEHIHFDEGPSVMDGETALKFSRSRSGTHGGDFARSERQHALLLGIKDELLSIYTIGKIDEIFDQFVDMVRTDLDIPTIKNLTQIFGSPEDYNIRFVSVNDQNVLVATQSFDGQFILIPKEGEGVWTGVQSFIYGQINADN